MSAMTGAARMKIAGRMILFVALTILLLFWGAMLLIYILGSSTSSQIGFSLFLMGASLSIILAIPGAALWIAGWIVEGFAKN